MPQICFAHFASIATSTYQTIHVFVRNEPYYWSLYLGLFDAVRRLLKSGPELSRQRITEWGNGADFFRNVHWHASQTKEARCNCQRADWSRNGDAEEQTLGLGWGMH
jgi:hypothetical protein